MLVSLFTYHENKRVLVFCLVVLVRFGGVHVPVFVVVRVHGLLIGGVLARVRELVSDLVLVLVLVLVSARAYA